MMWLMLQQDQPEDYVIGTGKSPSVRDLVELSFKHAGLEMEKHLVIDPKFFRPAEVDKLLADSSKAKSKLGWEPKGELSRRLVEMMVRADLEHESGGGNGRAEAAAKASRATPPSN